MTLPCYLQIWVVDKDTGMPVEGVLIKTSGTSWPTWEKTKSGGDVGIWELLFIPYSITVSKSGYRTQEIGKTAVFPYEFMRIEMEKL